MEVSQEVLDRVAEEAKKADGRLPCLRAFALAEELDVPVRMIGEAANQTSVKIASCQLGCFQ